MIQKLNSLVVVPLFALLSGCSKFSVSPILASLNQSSSVPADLNQPAGEAMDCEDARLMAAFSQTFWPFTKSKCASCHGAGVTGRAFASTNLSEAFDSFRSPSTRGFKEARLKANALNSLHGSPATNGEMNRSAVEQAATEWSKLAAEICAAKPTPTPTPAATPTSATPAPGSTPTPSPTSTPVASTPIPSGDVSGTSVAIVNQSNMLLTYKNLVGTNLSESTKNKIYNNPRYMIGIRGSRRYLMPPSSKPSGYTSGTLMISMIAATEHCRDLVDKEKGLGSNQRRFFVGVDFSKSDLQSFPASEVGTALAKGFWFREASSAESAAFQGLISELKMQSLNPSQAAVLMCTMALTSISSNVR